MSRVEEVYRPALDGKKIPILTLDHKWHQLFTQTETNQTIQRLEQQVNELLQRQGKLTTESKDIKKIKEKLRNEIVILMDELNGKEPGKTASKKLEENKRLINDCNDKLESYQDELLDIPHELERVNKELMLVTMDSCYHTFQENTVEINEIAAWIKKIRIELKKKVVRKQEGEIRNQQLYAYMHNIFGAEVMELFDMSYDPSAKPVTKKHKEGE
ncbi:MAG: hypothetical protein RRX92_06040 [Lachnospiraceae bacterium]